jgi:hypothetical protein
MSTAAGPAPRWAPPGLLLVGLLGLALIVYFDLGPPLAFNDDWGFAWNVRHFWFPPRTYPADSALALVQVTFAWLVTLGSHADPRWLRLSEVPFVLLLMAASAALAGRLGASRAWMAVAGLAPLASPVFTADATTFMTDVPYTALLMAAAWAGVAWLRSGSRTGMVLCVLFTLLAGLQRQVGVAIPVGVTLAILLARPRPREDWAGVVMLWAAAALAIIGPAALNLTPPTQANRLQAALHIDPIYPLAGFLFLPGMVGLALLPFAAGLWTAGSGGGRWRGPLLFGYLLVQGLVFWVAQFDIFPGNVFTPRSLNWTFMPGAKPYIYPAWSILVLEAAAVAATAGMLWRHRLWWPNRERPESRLLLLIALTQFLPMLLLSYLTFDRYYLPVVAPLVPLAAAAATHTIRPRLAIGYALGAVAFGLALYAVGEQDYQAWQDARDQVARMAYQQASPLQVNAGYEANAVYGEVPTYDRTGKILSGLAKPGARDFSAAGPDDPVLVLYFGAPDDPRPGVTYRSLASGRIVMAPPTPSPSPRR